MSEELPERRFRTLFISDVHLGARGSQAEQLLDFLKSHDADTIYLNAAQVRRRYGVPATLGLLPGRVTFIIDRSGVVRRTFNSQFQATQHVAEALEALRRLERPGAGTA